MLNHGEAVAEIPNQALTDDAPLYKRPLARWEPAVPREMPGHIKLSAGGDFTEDLKRLLASPNICSKRWVWQQYDHMVQTNTVEAPGAGDAGVIRIKGSRRGLAMALDGNGRWCYLDPRLGAMHSVAEAARKVACSERLRRRHQLPQFWQSRKAAHHVAVLANHRRHHQSLRGVGDSHHRGQRQLL